MPATTEMLIEEIMRIKEQITAQRDAGQDTLELEESLAMKAAQLNEATAALRQRRVLKG